MRREKESIDRVTVNAKRYLGFILIHSFSIGVDLESEIESVQSILQHGLDGGWSLGRLGTSVDGTGCG